MLNRDKISLMQQKVILENDDDVKKLNDDAGEKSEDKVISLDEAISLCQKYISSVATSDYRKESDPARKRDKTKTVINTFVNAAKPIVKNEADGSNYNLIELKKVLIDEITHYGPITKAMEDPEIDEIRANGPRQIFVEKAGKSQKWTPEFRDEEHMLKTVSKLVGVSKVRLTPKAPMVNARTIEGYRVNATHSEISPYDVPAFVIRKFSKHSMNGDSLLKGESFSINMLRLLKLIPKADLSWVTVGATGSGKTTLNEVLVKEIPDDKRIITIENPSEMRLLKKVNGEYVNDVLQYESVREDDDASPATMENLLVNAMRQSPHWIGPGELRTPGEFATALRAAQTGHYFFTTLHAEGDEEAIYRFLTAYLMISNEPAELALRNICSAVKFVIFQEKLADNSRKVTSISEVLGSEGLKPIMNQIYKFECTDVEKDEKGKINKIVGKHKRVGCISEKTQQFMIKAGTARSEFEFLTKEPNSGEYESYSEGEGIGVFG